MRENNKMREWNKKKVKRIKCHLKINIMPKYLFNAKN